MWFTPWTDPRGLLVLPTSTHCYIKSKNCFFLINSLSFTGLLHYRPKLSLVPTQCYLCTHYSQLLISLSPPPFLAWCTQSHPSRWLKGISLRKLSTSTPTYTWPPLRYGSQSSLLHLGRAHFSLEYSSSRYLCILQLFASLIEKFGFYFSSFFLLLSMMKNISHCFYILTGSRSLQVFLHMQRQFPEVYTNTMPSVEWV